MDKNQGLGGTQRLPNTVTEYRAKLPLGDEQVTITGSDIVGVKNRVSTLLGHGTRIEEDGPGFYVIYQGSNTKPLGCINEQTVLENQSVNWFNENRMKQAVA